MSMIWVLRSAVARLDSLLLAEGVTVSRKGDLRHKVVQLRSDLCTLEQCILKEAKTDNFNEELKRKVTQLAYDIEEAAESYTWQRAASKDKSSLYVCLDKCLSIGTSLRGKVRKFQKRIYALTRVIGIDREGETSRGESMGPINTSSSTATPNCSPTIIGMNKDREDILHHFFGEARLSFVGLCGVGGSGKTTLARFMYDNVLASHFECCIWVSVGKPFSLTETVISMLHSISLGSKKEDDISKVTTNALRHELYETLKKIQFLVVLDGVRKTEDWDMLKTAFPDAGNGSRVIITTRDVQTARDWNLRVSYSHDLCLLTEDESWELFILKFGLRNTDLSINPWMEVIGREIVGCCEGLPLAIVVVSGLLKARISSEYWEQILQKLKGDQSLGKIEHILALSIDELPSYLKPCLCCLALFPCVKSIPREKLFLLWLAEGLISPSALHGKTRMEVAEEYFNQLVSRNLITPVDDPVPGLARSVLCNVHDLIHTMCLVRGKEEECLEVINSANYRSRISNLTRRVTLHLIEFEDEDVKWFLQCIPEVCRIRTILFYRTYEKVKRAGCSEKPPFQLKDFQSTRVLDFDGIRFQDERLLGGMEKLIHLRHLSFRGCFLEELPSTICKLLLLETLDLCVRDSCEMTIPNVLQKLLNLKFLYFPSKFRSATKDKLKIDSLTQLEILENFDALVCDSDDLRELEHLQRLTAVMHAKEVDLQNIVCAMRRINDLRHSSLVVNNLYFTIISGKCVVAEDLFRCNFIHTLDFNGIVHKFPRNGSNLHMIGSNFTKMCLRSCELEEDPFPILGTLPNLRSLTLAGIVFSGKVMACYSGHFPQLRCLKLRAVRFLEKLEIMGGSMLCLSILTIGLCCKLQMLPDALCEIPSFQKLLVGSMPRMFEKEVYDFNKRRRSLGYRLISVAYYEY